MVNVTREILGHPITVTALQAGADWNVIITGGCTPHVGSVSLAEYENGKVNLRNLLRNEHKDQIVGDHFAYELAQHLHCTICVSCGIHFDAPTREGLKQIVALTDDMLTELYSLI